MDSSDQRFVNGGIRSPCQLRIREKAQFGSFVEIKAIVLKSMFVQCWVPECQADLCHSVVTGTLKAAQ